MCIRNMRSDDWNQVSKIYKDGIDTKVATFQDFVSTYEEWGKEYIDDFKIVYIEDDKILGFAALRKISPRKAYDGMLEITIYVDKDSQGKGVGIKLINHLIEASEKSGYWSLQSTILGGNEASIKLHEKCGFRVIGKKEKVGRMDTGVWHDLVLMERRSKLVGAE